MLRILALIAGCAAAVPLPCDAQLFTEVDHVDLATIDPDTNDGRLGRSVALAAGGRVLLAAAPQKDDPVDGSSQNGALYSFVVAANGTLQFSQELAPTDQFRFGETLAADGAWAAVGEAGPRVHLLRYVGGNWVEAQVLRLADDVVEPPDVDVRGITSWASMDGDLLALGDHTAFVTVGATTYADAGAVVLFRRGAGDVWQFEAVLRAPEPAVFAEFGKSVSVSGDRVLVGAQYDEVEGVEVGGAFVFERTGGSWSHVATLRNHEEEGSDRFGWSVALDGDTAVVGCATCFVFPDIGDPVSTGSFFAFERNLGGSGNWGLRGEYLGSTPSSNDNFSESLRLRGDVLLVGESNAEEASFFVRRSSGWQEAALLPSGDTGASLYGISVDFMGGHAVIGAERWPDNEANDIFGAVSSWFAPTVAACGGNFDGIFCDGYET